MTASRKTPTFIFLITILWLGSAYWIRSQFLPYDVKNTDVGTYLFQAQTFADGKLHRDTPEPREFFQQWQVIVRDKTYSYYAPVHALFLSVPIILNLNPWIVPWLLSGVSLVLVYVWGKKITNEKTGLLASFLLAMSPFFAANIPSLLSHSTTFFLTILFLITAHSWKQTGLSKFAFFTGVLLALIYATRSANAAALGIVWIPYIIYIRAGKIKEEWNAWFSFGLGAGFIAVPLLIYYKSLSGYWTLDLFKEYWPRNKFGFGHNLGRGEPGHYFQTYTHHDWAGFFHNLKYSFSGLAEWWTGSLWVSLVLVSLFLVLIILSFSSQACGGISRVKEDEIPHSVRNDTLRGFNELPTIILWAFVHIILYAFYYTQSTPPTGPRYLSEIMPALAILSSWTIVRLWEYKIGSWISGGLVILLIIFGVTKKIDFYRENARSIPVQKQLENTVLQNAQAPALVLIRSFWIGHPFPIFLNQSDMKGPILFACDCGGEDRKLISQYPERNAYVLAVNPTKSSVEFDLIQIYSGTNHTWLKDPEEILAPFYLGNRFSEPLKLQGEEFRKLFHPRPEEIVSQ